MPSRPYPFISTHRIEAKEQQTISAIMKSLNLALCTLIINFANAYQGDMTYYTPGLPSSPTNSLQTLLIIYQALAPAVTPTATPTPS